MDQPRRMLSECAINTTTSSQDATSGAPAAPCRTCLSNAVRTWLFGGWLRSKSFMDLTKKGTWQGESKKGVGPQWLHVKANTPRTSSLLLSCSDIMLASYLKIQFPQIARAWHMGLWLHNHAKLQGTYRKLLLSVFAAASFRWQPRYIVHPSISLCNCCLPLSPTCHMPPTV